MNKTKMAVSMTLRLALMAVIMVGALRLAAGTWHYWQAWAFCGVFFVISTIISFYFLVYDPIFLERRMKWRETEPQQIVGQTLISIFYIISILLPGLDHRYGWSHVPTALVIAADVLIIISFLLIFRVFEENRYAASTIQVESGQKVITTGPYAIVRHPMYSGALPLFIATPLALDSYWALFTALPLVIGLIFRIKNEEQVLLRDLPGYEDYCRKLRWRLIPWVW